MTQGSVSHREDVEQLGRRFAEFRSTHAVRSRLPEELWAAAAKLARRDGIEATARALDVDRPSLQKWTDRFEPRAASKGRGSLARQRRAGRTRARCSRLRGTAGADYRRGAELPGGSRIAARCEAAAGVEGHSNQQTGRADSRVCGVVSMLQITPQMRILVAVEAVDFRKGIDSLAELCRAKLNADPFSGCLFVFRSRRATSIKVLVYDGQGFWLATKRLSKGRFRWWPQGEESRHDRCGCIKRRCCWRRATRTSMRLRCGATS